MWRKRSAIWCGFLIASAGQGATPAAKTSIYFYHDDHYRWCALGSQKRFMGRTDAQSDYGDETVIDTGEIIYRKGVAVEVQESLTNSEYEVIDERTYSLDRAGNIVAVRMNVTEQDSNSKTVRSYAYKVTSSGYQPLTAQAAKAARDFHLRQTRALSAFPFATMLEKARTNPLGGPYCTGRMKG